MFVRTVTHYYTGRVVGVSDKAILLEDAAWIADTGRFADALRTGILSEVEPYPDGVIEIIANRPLSIGKPTSSGRSGSLSTGRTTGRHQISASADSLSLSPVRRGDVRFRSRRQAPDRDG